MTDVSEIKGFTPGPWSVDPDDRDGMEWNIHIVEAERPHHRVCFMASDGPNEANARLIAAAPDMHAEIARLRREKAELVTAIEMHVAAIKAAFGAPGDWGYHDRKGTALLSLYTFRAALRAATETPGGGSDVSPVSDGSNRDSRPSTPDLMDALREAVRSFATEKGDPT